MDAKHLFRFRSQSWVFKFIRHSADEALDPVNRFKRKRYCFVPDTATVYITTLKTTSENGSIGKRSPEWNDLKTVMFESAVFLVWTAKTMLTENDDVTTPPPGCTPLNREYHRHFQVASLLVAVVFNLLTLLEADLTLLVFQEENKILEGFLACQFSGGSVIKQLGRSPPKPRQDQGDFLAVGQI